MRRPAIGAIFLLCSMAASEALLLAEDDTTVYPVLTVHGQSFTNARIVRVTSAYAIIDFDAGGTRLLISDLPDDLQRKFGYDPAKAKQELDAEFKRNPRLQELRSEQLAAETEPLSADWPQWRGPNRNGAVKSGTVLAAIWPADGPRRLWSCRELPDGGSSSPVIAKDRVYAYIHQKAQEKDTVVCLDAATGAKQWQQDFPVGVETMHEASGSPCVTGDVCLVTGARTCYALNAITGKLLWKKATADETPPTDPGVSQFDQEFSSSFTTVAGVGVVLCGPAFGFDPGTGLIQWKGSEPGGWAGAITSAAVWRASHVIYAGRDRLCCVEAKSGRLEWELDGSKEFTTYAPTPAVAGDKLVALHRGWLKCFDLATGGPRELWRVPCGDEYSSPVANGDRVYTTSPKAINRANIGSAGQQGPYNLICRSLRTGTVLWQTAIANAQYSSPILANEYILVLTDNGGEIAMFDSRDGRLLATTAVGARPCSSPSIANGRLFLRVSHGMACYDLSASGNAQAAK